MEMERRLSRRIIKRRVMSRLSMRIIQRRSMNKLSRRMIQRRMTKYLRTNQFQSCLQTPRTTTSLWTLSLVKLTMN